MVAFESSTKIIATGANPAGASEATVTIGSLNDGFVYHIKSIYIPVVVANAPTVIDIQIGDGTSLIFSEATGTAVAVGTFAIQGQRVAANRTAGDGSEIIALPENLIVPGGFQIDTITATLANADYGVPVVFGAKLKARR